MNVTITKYDNYVLVKFEGTIDESSKASFDEHLHPLLATPGRRILIDLSGSDRINSVGIGQLVTLVSRANTKGVWIVMACPSPFVSSIFQVTKLVNFFEIVDSIEEGVSLLIDSP